MKKIVRKFLKTYSSGKYGSSGICKIDSDVIDLFLDRATEWQLSEIKFISELVDDSDIDGLDDVEKCVLNAIKE